MSTLSALYVPRGHSAEQTLATLREHLGRRRGRSTIRNAPDFGWIEVDLEGAFDDGRLAKALSGHLDPEVVSATIQTAASVFVLARYRRGECVRRVAAADGARWEVVGTSEQWEAHFFDDDDGAEAADVEDPAEKKAIETLWAGKKLVDGAEWPIAGSSASYAALAGALGLERAEELFAFRERAATERVGRASRSRLAMAVGVVLLLALAFWLGAMR